MTTDTPHARIRAYVLSEVLRGEDPDRFADDADLIDSGILDSLAIMQLVSFLEKTFDIKVETEEVIPEHFASVNALAKFVVGKPGAA